MPDREKVIKWLEIHTGLISSCEDGCPYFIGDGRKCKDLLKDALSVLKEQEPQLVLNIGDQISCKSGSCPKCGKMLNTTCNKRYCGDCGQAVKWE